MTGRRFCTGFDKRLRCGIDWKEIYHIEELLR